MKNSSVKRVLFVLLSVGSVIYSEAQTASAINVTTTAVPFLRISPDARSGGMGDVGIATTPDVNAPFWNLAKTAFAKTNTAIGFTYTPWLKDLGLNDVYLASGSFYHKIDELNVISASMRYFNLGTIQFTDESGNQLNTSNPRELGVDFGYARKLTDKIGIGVSIRYINSKLASGAVGSTVYKAGTTVAGDLSIFKNAPGENGQGFAWGVTLSNLGGKIGYTDDALSKDYIPANMGLGIAYTSVPDESNRITFAMDINKLLVPAYPTLNGNDTTEYNNDVTTYKTQSVVNSWFKSFNGGNQIKTFQASLGIEYVYAEQFALRAGYFYEDVSQGGRQYFSFGLGLKYNVIGINMSYLAPSGNGITRSPLSNTLRFGVSFDLDGGAASTSSDTPAPEN